MPGVYSITNMRSGKVYFGSTMRPFAQRWKEHRHRLRAGTHDNHGLLRDWQKDGVKSFCFSIIEELGNSDQPAKREQWHLDKARETGLSVYNVGAIVGFPRLGEHHTKEAKRKIGIASRRRIITEEARKHMSESGRARHWKPSREHQKQLFCSRAKSYPALRHRETGDIIPAGIGLRRLCMQYGWNLSSLRNLLLGKWSHYKGWQLLEQRAIS